MILKDCEHNGEGLLVTHVDSLIHPSVIVADTLHCHGMVFSSEGQLFVFGI